MLLVSKANDKYINARPEFNYYVHEYPDGQKVNFPYMGELTLEPPIIMVKIQHNMIFPSGFLEFYR